jgi:hypothetical protein
MPIVNGKEYPYTAKGIAAAKAMRKKRKGESDSAHKARLRTYGFGNPNE